MSGVTISSLAPLISIAAALVVLLLVVAFSRGHLTAFLTTLTGLVVTLLITIGGFNMEPHRAMHLLLIDGYANFFTLLFVTSAIVTALFGHSYLQGRRGELEEFYILLVIATLGAIVMAAATHFASFILGLEILSIALYSMVAYPEEEHAPLEAAMKYLVLSAVASTTILFGMAMIYNATGNMQFVSTTSKVAPQDMLYRQVGYVMLFSGLAFKLSLVPFHMWTPDVYQGAPAPVAGYIATVSKTAVFALLFRFALTSDSLQIPVVTFLLAAMAVLSMVLGNILALRQANLKRLLAYSSIAHMGYLIIAVLGIVYLDRSTFPAETALIYLAGYMAMTLTAFGVVSILSSAEGGDDAESIEAYVGLFWRNPVAATALTIALLSLMGMPLTAGFIGKFYLVNISIMSGAWLLLWTLILGSAISVYYYVKVIYAMTLTRDPSELYPHPSSTGVGLAAVSTLGATVIIIGVIPAPLIGAIRALLEQFGM
ncbi:MAG: NADH-quinone oxidoreductase subunit NuoN [Pseudomonadales bacterium]|nr:NADH-quinone oxidoreductase subunit NuoN [Pseudomonadales bacterium]